MGPYKIIQQINPVSYKLLLPYMSVYPVFHVSHIRPATSGPLDKGMVSPTPPEAIEIEGTPVYRVHRLPPLGTSSQTPESATENWPMERPHSIMERVAISVAPSGAGCREGNSVTSEF